MRIGILNSPRIKSGGKQLSATIIDSLLRDREHEYVVINQDGESPRYGGANVRTVTLDKDRSRLVRYLRAGSMLFGVRHFGGKYEALKELALDLLVTTPTASLAGIYAGIPYTCQVADVMHRFYSRSPDYTFGEIVRRDICYSRSVKGALRCIVDSECGAEHVNRFFGIPRNRIKAISMVAPPYIYELKSNTNAWADHLVRNFDLPNTFLFYPAQFWAHKNHIRLLEALRMLRDNDKLVVPLVLTGSEKNNLAIVKRFLSDNNMDSQVRILGYVDESQMVALYKRCKALVFPTLFGPTNIPIIEAFVMGKPVLCSNLFGMPEQVGDAGILFNPLNSAEIASAIRRIWNDPELYGSLTSRAIKRAGLFTLEGYTKQWLEVVSEAIDEIDGVGTTKGSM